MLFQRRFVTLFALVALLFGNVAGWVHVGSHQHDHSGHCCESIASGIDDCSCVNQTHHHDEHSDCCQHEDVSLPPNTSFDSLVVAVLPQDFQPEPAEPCDHDSDDCSICQSFFASRDAVALPGDLAEFLLADISSELVIFEPTWVASIDLSALSVRGPPLA